MTDRLPWIENAWYAALWGEELTAGSLVPRTMLGVPVVLYRREDGAPAALEDCCMHRFVPLSLGKLLAGDRVQCGYHGLEYDTTGRCVANPHGTRKLPTATIRSFTCVERSGMIWTWMGTAPADRAALPDLSIFDRTPAEFHAKRDGIVVRANYRLVLNNLLDLSHVAYVHNGLIGNDDMVSVEQTTVRESAEAVTVARTWPNVSVSGNFRRFYPHRERGDKWNDLTWSAPCNVTLSAGYTQVGAPRDAGSEIVAAHLLTPETEESTRYHFSAVRLHVRDEDLADNAAAMDEFSRVRRFAFAEQDGPIIEAQQRTMDGYARGRRPVLLSVDEGAARYNRMIDRLLDEQHRAAAPTENALS